MFFLFLLQTCTFSCVCSCLEKQDTQNKADKVDLNRGRTEIIFSHLQPDSLFAHNFLQGLTHTFTYYAGVPNTQILGICSLMVIYVCPQYVHYNGDRIKYCSNKLSKRHSKYSYRISDVISAMRKIWVFVL